MLNETLTSKATRQEVQEELLRLSETATNEERIGAVMRPVHAACEGTLSDSEVTTAGNFARSVLQEQPNDADHEERRELLRIIDERILELSSSARQDLDSIVPTDDGDSLPGTLPPARPPIRTTSEATAATAA